MIRAAEKKFWGCPELVESLLLFMDTLAIRRLLQVLILVVLAIVKVIIKTFIVQIYLMEHSHVLHDTGTPAHSQHCPGQDHVEEADKKDLL